MSQQNFPRQQQTTQPGRRSEMIPKPDTDGANYLSAGKLKNKVAFITGGDSGIGRAVAVHFAKEGASVAIMYKEETPDAQETQDVVEQQGGRCLTILGDIRSEDFCQHAIRSAMQEFGQLDILINNAAEQHPQKNFSDITTDQFEQTFHTNVFGMFYCTKFALPHLKQGASIINTTSVTAYRGSPGLIDYSATKGAIVAFTRSLALNLVDQGIRVNGVAPGPVWTPLIPSTFDEEKVAKFGQETPMKRAAQPEEIAPAYVYLASDDASYVTGQVIHLNGGEIING